MCKYGLWVQKYHLRKLLLSMLRVAAWTSSPGKTGPLPMRRWRSTEFMQELVGESSMQGLESSSADKQVSSSLSNLILTILILIWLLLKHSVNVNDDDHRRSVLIFFLSHISLTILRNILCVVELHQLAGWRGKQCHLPAQVWIGCWWIILVTMTIEILTVTTAPLNVRERWEWKQEYELLLQ